jgi:hypothetical protein
MTKKEVLNDIMYDLKMKDSVYFEADDDSYSAGKLLNGGYVIEGVSRYIEVPNLTAARKEIAKLGSKLLWL